MSTFEERYERVMQRTMTALQLAAMSVADLPRDTDEERIVHAEAHLRELRAIGRTLHDPTRYHTP